MMKFRKIYDKERPSPKLRCDDPSLCLAHQISETSIEKLVKLAQQNPHLAPHILHDDREPQYGDCPSPIDFQDALEVVARGEEAFYSLPAQVRSKFTNPTQFLTWLEDPANYDEAYKLGLLDPEKVEKRRQKMEQQIKKQEEQSKLAQSE